ncbi:MAG TPA: 2-dehydro-3-deoxy-D-gluconate 5-dehydrogenase KduD [Gemmatimonadaceae bacterium]
MTTLEYPKLFSVEGKCALVTGASRGLGRAMAEALASAGANVVCASHSVAGTAGTVAAIRSRGRDAWALEADLRRPEAAEMLAEAAQDAAGQVDILVNNAGTIRRAPAADHSYEDWSEVLRTNLDAAFILSQRLGRGMLERGEGKIINVASLLSFSGGITVPGYTASKHAIAGLTKALANEWGGRGVQVNAIAPGYMETDNTSALRDDAKRFADISARIPAGRWGTPADLAGAVVFLASPASNYVNGHVLVVDGGWMAR